MDNARYHRVLPLARVKHFTHAAGDNDDASVCMLWREVLDARYHPLFLSACKRYIHMI